MKISVCCIVMLLKFGYYQYLSYADSIHFAPSLEDKQDIFRKYVRISNYLNVYIYINILINEVIDLGFLKDFIIFFFF